MFFALLLIFIGTTLLLSTFNLIEMTFVRFIMIFFAVLFAYDGIEDMIRKGFPSGLTSLVIAVLLILNALRILITGFWQAVGIVFAVSLIKWGIEIIKSIRKRKHGSENYSGGDKN